MRAGQVTSQGRTTYAQLTQRAARRMAEASIRLRRWEWDQESRASGLSMHADLRHALAHLGRTLVQLDGSKGRKGQLLDEQVLNRVQRQALAHPWDQPRPTGGPPGDISDAAVLIRAAADLWSTHHTLDGDPRSPEASRMRHPATLGAACREWRTLVAIAEHLGDGLGAARGTARGTALGTTLGTARGTTLGADREPGLRGSRPGSPAAIAARVPSPREPAIAAGATSPRPTAIAAGTTSPRPTAIAAGVTSRREPATSRVTAPGEPARSAAARPMGRSQPRAADPDATLLELPLARPGVRVGVPAVEELADRVAHLRHRAWAGAQRGQLPATAYLNLAAIGSALHCAVAAQLGRAARGEPPEASLLASAGQAEEAARRWQQVAEQVAPLRTAHKPGHAIQVQRLAVKALLDRAVSEGGARDTATALLDIAHAFDEVADYSVRSLLAAQRRGQLLIQGSALGREALLDCPDLVEGRLQDRPVPVPDVVLDQICSAFRAIRELPPPASPDLAPPAA